MQSSKITVCPSVEALETYQQDNPTKYLCLYLAHKDDAGWEKSTSRVYMNQLWDNFSYLPVDIEAHDTASLERIYDLAEATPRIIAINQTQPHKSNPVLMRRLHTDMPSVDTVVKDTVDTLVPLNLNGPSFFSWLSTVVDDVAAYHYAVLGVGGAGAPIAREAASHRPLSLTLVDRADKSALAQELVSQTHTAYYPSLNTVPQLPAPVILINAAGKEGVSGSETLAVFLARYQSADLTYIDLRPQLEIVEVEYALAHSFVAYTGYGMNAHNDYTLVEKIAALTDNVPPSFESFARLVTAAS